MRRKKEVTPENGAIEINSKKANELQSIFNTELGNFHKGGRGKNNRVTQILPIPENQSVSFSVYEIVMPKNVLDEIGKNLIETTDFINYIFMVGGIPKWSRKMALQTMDFMGASKVPAEGEKSLYELFVTEGYTSVTLFYSEGVVKSLAKTSDGQDVTIDLMERLNSFLEENGV